ncbi:hypothetical protein HRS9122_09083 [Pyrenophora teres f. teres]|nr:hypothetical protein HRS9122_09083 [Pyrenophora teres f. teres]
MGDFSTLIAFAIAHCKPLDVKHLAPFETTSSYPHASFLSFSLHASTVWASDTQSPAGGAIGATIVPKVIMQTFQQPFDPQDIPAISGGPFDVPARVTCQFAALRLRARAAIARHAPQQHLALYIHHNGGTLRLRASGYLKQYRED